MAPRHLELRHRWGHHPLWDLDQDADVDPASLGLPASVVDRLGAWAARWDTTFDLTQPDHRTVEQFVVIELGRDGARLWRALLGLLPPGEVALSYHHEGVHYTDPAELPPEWRFS
jgi:hypothetical protein